eukprot:TRINITY_DN5221_c0_g1_i5.p1 TRINITY_DN5221_c0_g1~~TRINITY_DN5221_c0_g1_i5.p1  ORF type:complete len:1027 (+),score=255.48 TRINITY_DN5221_c0_g1_i5:89-3169(+)
MSRTQGELWSWGSHSRFQLGHFELDNNGELAAVQKAKYPVPQFVAAVHETGRSVKAVACGQSHTMAIVTGGDCDQLWGWGFSGFGQLGMGDKVDQLIPRQVPGITEPVKQVACGLTHTLALSEGGTLWCWGEGRFGKLGLGPDLMTEDVASPTQIETLSEIAQVFAGGNQSACLTRNGSLITWGWNSNGQLGLGFTTDPLSGVPTPTHVGEANRRVIEHIDRNVVRTEGEMGSRLGQVWEYLITTLRMKLMGLQDRPARDLLKLFQRTENSVKEDQVKMIKDVTRTGANDDVSSRMLELLVEIFHQMNLYAQVNEEDSSDLKFNFIAVGERHMVGISGSILYSWGCNAKGQLGRETPGNRDAPRPEKIANFSPITTVACGMAHTAAILDGTVYTWGDKETGRLGYDINLLGEQVRPREVDIGSDGGAPRNAVQVCCGEFHTAVLTGGIGNVITWGFNNMGQCGYPPNADEEGKPVGHAPAVVPALSGVCAIASGNEHIVTVVRSDEVFLQLCRDGNMADVEKLREEGVRASSLFDDGGRTALFHAIEFGHFNLASKLVTKHGVNVDHVDCSGRTALHVAVEQRHTICVRLLAETLHCHLSLQTEAYKLTPLHIATKMQDLDLAQLLVLAGAPINTPDATGKTPLDYLSTQDAARVRTLTGSCDVAILCAIPEQKFAKQLATNLENHGFSVWADDTDVTYPFNDDTCVASCSVKRRLTQSRAVIWIVSKNSVACDLSKQQLRFSKQLNKPIFPIWFQVLQTLPAEVEHLIYRTQLVDFSEKDTYQESLAKLAQGLQLAIEGKVLQDDETDEEPTLSADEKLEQQQQLKFLITQIQKKQQYLFMCFHWTDTVLADELIVMLSKYGWLCYPGYNQVHTTKQNSEMLAHCSAFILCLTQKSANSGLVKNQMAMAENRDILTFPVHFERGITLHADMKYSLSRAPRFMFAQVAEKEASVQQLNRALSLGLHIKGKECSVLHLKRKITCTRHKTATTNNRVQEIRGILAQIEEQNRKLRLATTVGAAGSGTV